MRNLFKVAFMIATAFVYIACNNDDNSGTEKNLQTKVDTYIQFENVFNNNTFELGKDYVTTSNRIVNISALKYMITDIVLKGAEGTEDIALSTQESFHIVDQACDVTFKKYLTNIPDGRYSQISFRYGVSEEVHEKGTDYQGDMLVAAKKFGMDWGWTLGYRFLTYEGTYNDNVFKIHNGSHGSDIGGHGHGVQNNETHSHVENIHDKHSIAHKQDPTGEHVIQHEKAEDKSTHDSDPARIDNSKVITLDFSNEGAILVGENTSPKIHLKIDIAKILEGIETIVLDGDIILDIDKSPKIANNIKNIFTVDHIHATETLQFLSETLEECETKNANDVEEHDHSGHNH